MTEVSPCLFFLFVFSMLTHGSDCQTGISLNNIALIKIFIIKYVSATREVACLLMLNYLDFTYIFFFPSCIFLLNVIHLIQRCFPFNALAACIAGTLCRVLRNNESTPAKGQIKC